jgi:hypothetical protein
MIFTGIGGLALAFALYRSKLIPRFISIVGIFGYGMLLGITPLLLLGVLSLDGVVTIILMPCALFEIVLFPLWLIIKGFNTSAVTSKVVP